MNIGQFVRHGDVIFIKVDDSEVPSEVSRADKDHPAPNQAVAAYGEVTGHRHLITASEGVELNLFEVPGLKNASEMASGRVGNTQDGGLLADRYLRIVAPEDAAEAALITHEEHDTIALPTGTFRVRIQKEYSPEAIRNVMD